MKCLKILLFMLVLLFLSASSIILEAQTDDDSTNTTESNVDSLKDRSLSFSGYPYAYYTPETKFAAGAGGILIFYTDDKVKTSPSKLTLGGYYSSTGQYKITLDPVFYFDENKFYGELPISFGHFVDKFWGIGNQTIETETEPYTRDQIAATLKVQAPPFWFSADRAGMIVDYDKTTMDDKKENQYLLNDEVIGSNGGQLIGFGSDLLWDDRDNIFFPNSGVYQYFKAIIYPSLSDYQFYLIELELKHYAAFSEDHVLAVNFYVEAAGGETPFYKLPALGGSSRMRGYFQGRYRDNIYSMFQLEYRQYFWWKLGFVVFAGVGDVANEITKFRIDELKYSYGFGLRFLFDKENKVNLRADLGFGNDGNSGIYFGIEEAF